MTFSVKMAGTQNKTAILFIICGLCFINSSIGQSLRNPSMEGEPLDATMPDAWHACQEGTTPDIGPGPWGIETEPYDGETYVGLITRPNGTWEAIGQRFSAPLTAGECYSMSIVAAHADTYAGYNNNGRLRVYIGSDKCGYDQLILDIKSLKHTDWKAYEMKFTPTSDAQYIILESFHPEGKRSSSGNILIDHISKPILCNRA